MRRYVRAQYSAVLKYRTREKVLIIGWHDNKSVATSFQQKGSVIEKICTLKRILHRSEQTLEGGVKDLSNRSSFDIAKFWVQELQMNEEECKIYLTGTKLDLVECGRITKKVDTFEATSYAEENHATLIETSSRDNYNVQKVFQTIADDFTADLNNTTDLQEDATSSNATCSEMDLPALHCKVVILGRQAVGKTKLVETFSNGHYTESEYLMAIGAGHKVARVLSNNKAVVFEIWDTAGADRLQAISRLYHREAKAAIVCYDVTDRASFDKAKFWVQQLTKNEEECKIYLTGTRLDLVESGEKTKEIGYFKASNYARENHATLIETPSKKNHKVQKVFQAIADDFTTNIRNASNS